MLALNLNFSAHKSPQAYLSAIHEEAAIADDAEHVSLHDAAFPFASHSSPAGAEVIDCLCCDVHSASKADHRNTAHTRYTRVATAAHVWLDELCGKRRRDTGAHGGQRVVQQQRVWRKAWVLPCEPHLCSAAASEWHLASGASQCVAERSQQQCYKGYLLVLVLS